MRFKHLRAITTGHGAFGFMRKRMYTQITACPVALAAFNTLEWFFTRMHHFVCFQILRKKIDYLTGYNVARNCRRVRCIRLWLFVFCLFRFGAVGSGRKNMFSQATEPFNSRKPLYVYYTLATFINAWKNFESLFHPTYVHCFFASVNSHTYKSVQSAT